MTDLLPLLLSCTTLTTMWAAGNHKWWAWLVGLVGQAGWFLFIVLFGAWGLLPMAIVLTVIYARNLRKWHHEKVLQGN